MAPVLFQVQITCKDTVATVLVLRSPERDASISLWLREQWCLMSDAFPTVGGTGLGRALSEQGVRRPQEQERCPGRLPQRCALHSLLAHSAQPLCSAWERSTCVLACWRQLCAIYTSPLCIAPAQLPTTAATFPALLCSSKVSEFRAGLLYQSHSISLHLWSAHALRVHPAVW